MKIVRLYFPLKWSKSMKEHERKLLTYQQLQNTVVLVGSGATASDSTLSQPLGKFIASSFSSLATISTASASWHNTGWHHGMRGKMSSRTEQSPPRFQVFSSLSLPHGSFLDVCPQRVRTQWAACLFSWVIVQVRRCTALYVHGKRGNIRPV